MAKCLILAVAGSGKSTFLISEIVPGERTLLLTYTKSNIETLRHKVLTRWKYVPKYVSIQSYFTFLHSFCYKPFLVRKNGSQGIFFKSCQSRYASGMDRYISSNGFLYSNRIGQLLIKSNLLPDIVSRIEKYFDHIMVDEVQDFASHDFNFLLEIVKSTSLRLLLVGDYFQHTYGTSFDGNTNRTLHDNQENYLERFKRAGLNIDQSTLRKSWRCSKEVCRFVTDTLGIQIETNSLEEGSVRELVESSQIDSIYADSNVVKLFYQASRKYSGNVRNWGECKGDDSYQDVCVILNKKTADLYRNGRIRELPPETKNKLYVAITRSRRHVFFVEERRIKSKKKPTS